MILHTLLEQRCGDHVGIALRFDAIAAHFLGTLDNLSVENADHLAVPLPPPLEGLAAGYSLTDTNGNPYALPTVSTDVLNGDRVATVTDAALRVQIWGEGDPSNTLFEYECTIRKLWLQIAGDSEYGSEPAFLLSQQDGFWLSANSIVPTKKQLDQFFQGSAKRYDRADAILSFSLETNLVNIMLDTLPLIRLIGCIKYFDVLLPVDWELLQNGSDAFVIAKLNTLQLPGDQDPCPNAHNELSSSVDLPVDSQGNPTRKVSFDITHRPSNVPDLGGTEKASYFIYIPPNKLSDSAKKRIPTSFKRSKGDKWAIFKWFWRAHVALDAVQLIDVSAVADRFNIEFSTDSTIHADFSVKFKIACIEKEIFGISGYGEIKGVSIRLKAYWDASAQAIKYTSKGKVGSCWLDTDARIIWPFSMFFEAIANSIGPILIESYLVEELNSLRGTLLSAADIGLPGINAAGAMEHIQNQSVLYGIGFS